MGGTYIVQKGDRLHTLIAAASNMSLVRPDFALRLVMQDNPNIKNADLIYPGQLIFIRDRVAVGNVMKSESFNFSPLQPTLTSDIIKTSSDFPDTTAFGDPGINWASMSTTMALAGGSQMSSQLGIIATSASDDIQSIISSYNQMKAGKLSKHKHYSARKATLGNIKSKLGPMEEFILKGAAEDRLRMKYGPGKVNRAEPMLKQANKLQKVGNGLKYGGWALTVVGIVADSGFTHHGVCTATDTSSKNRAFVSGVAGIKGSVVGGYLGGLAVAFVLGSNPAGWAIAVGIVATAVVAGAASYGASEGAGKMYDEYGNGMDIVGAIPIDGNCSIYN